MKIVKEEGTKMYLHKEIGKGTMPNGKDCRLIQSNGGIHMQVYDEKGKWETYTLSYMELSKAIVEEIEALENGVEE